MKNSMFVSAFLLAAVAHLAIAAPLEPIGGEKGYLRMPFEPFSSHTFTIEVQAKERMSAIVYGEGTSPMAIYVFDKHGNCVAKDDQSLSVVSDDVAVEWHPRVQESYDIEVRNFGRRLNNAEIAIR